MRKVYLIYSFFLIVLLFSCGSKNEELRIFSQNFAEKARANQIDSLISVYPALVNIDSISVAGYDPQNIQIKKGNEGIYIVELTPSVSLNIKYEKGQPIVVDSYGLFVYPENIYELTKDLNIFDKGESDLTVNSIVQEKVMPYINFTTPDLSFFNVKGHVKTMIWDNTPGNTFCRTPWQTFWGWKATYEFNESGEWTNAKNLRMDPYTSIQGISRNLENQINKIVYPSDFGEEEIVYKWENNVLKTFSSAGSKGEFLYQDSILNSIDYEYSNTEFDVPAKIVLSDFQFDNIGNWISCNFVITTKETKRKITGEIIRKIEYYPLQ